MITIREAHKEDACFIASMVLAALHIDEHDDARLFHHMIDLVEDEGTLYFWQRCHIATDEGVPVGLCLAYDGKDYHERRLRSFSMPCSDGKPVSENNESLLQQADETGEGEYYIDSLAVVSSCRGKGIGRQLLVHAIAQAKEKGLRPTLLVDPANTSALRLYTSMGFKYGYGQFAFGMTYHKYIGDLSA